MSSDDAVRRALELRLAREQRARREAERLLEQKSLELFRANQNLLDLNRSLEGRVEERTRELEQARLLAVESSKAKSRFLANMSHEIRTPLNGVMGMLDMLLELGLDARKRELAEIARSSADTLLSLINDVLDVSKIEAGKMTIERIAFETLAPANDVVQLLNARASAKGIELSLEAEPDVPRGNLGDPTRIRQVLFNLAGNALKFTERGHVRIRVAIEEGGRNGRALRFSVVDTGLGVPLDKQALLFDAFTQADDSTTRRFGGTGLGLSISKQLVQLMGGTIGLESEQGRGSTFWFTIPCVAAEVPKKSTVEPAAALPVRSVRAGRRLRALLAEDNAINVRIALHALEKLDLDVTIVENGALALEALENGAFDVVFMDGHMPVLDGLDATRAWRERERERGGHVPVIALTACAMEGDEARFREAGMDGFLTKPLRFDALARAVAELETKSSAPAAGG